MGMDNLFRNAEIIKLAEENDVKFIRLQFTDLFGMSKNIAITRENLENALEHQVMFDGSSIDGFVRIEESDMVLYPDLDSFKVFPWRPQNGRVARLICDVHKTDGTPFEGDPRFILKKALKEADKMGYTFNVGPEVEFFLFHTDESGKPTTVTHDKGGYFDLSPMDLGEDARRDICLSLEDMGFVIEASHHEVADGQHEIDFRYGEALKAADNFMTFKLVVKTVARRHGLYATFMPKPITGMAGSGLHTNLSLSKNGVNVFYDPKDPMGLSGEAYSFMAGIMAHIKAITAVANPIVNSYKRLVSGYEAPVYITWATENRSPLIRIPAVRGDATRVELRSPDPSCNPYLTFAIVLAAGLDGIKRGLKPPASVEQNIYLMSEADRISKSIERLPENLEQALDALEKDTLICDTLGNHAVSMFLKAKRQEWNEYKTRVHTWETEQYLYRY
jgi:glutamine synthetase